MGDDSAFHINRIIGLSNAFEERQILPKIYPYANNGFGYATPLFYCDLFLYPFAFLYHFGVSAVICYKLTIMFYILIGNILTFYVINIITNNKIVSYIGLVLYTLSNYHLQNILLRSAFGEILAMSFMPLVVYAIYKIIIEHKDSWILLGVSYSLLVMSHLISVLLITGVFVILIIVFIVFNRKESSSIKRMILTVIKGTILAFLLTAWYLLPMLEQLMDQTFWLTPNAKHNDLSVTVQNVDNLFTIFACTNLETFNTLINTSAGLMIIITSLTYIFTKKNKYINVLIAIILVLYLTLFGVFPYEYLNIIQFLFRLYVLIVTLLTIVSIYSVVNINKRVVTKTILTISLIIGLINVVFINNQVLDTKYKFVYNNATQKDINTTDTTDKYSFNHQEIGGAEYLPHPTGYINFNEETPAIKYIDKNNNKIDSIWEYDRQFTRLEFSCNYDDSKTLIIPLSYYKGYKGYELVDGEYKPINLYDYEEYKELAIDTASGQHTYMVRYEGTTVQKVTLLISGLTFIGLIIYVIKKENEANV